MAKQVEMENDIEDLKRERDNLIEKSQKVGFQRWPKICCFFRKLAVNFFAFTGSTDKFSKEQHILGFIQYSGIRLNSLTYGSSKVWLLEPKSVKADCTVPNT